MKHLNLAVCAGALLFSLPGLAAAQSLTATGLALNFTLDRFYTGGGGGYGILDVATAVDGTLIGSGYGYGQLLQFSEGAGNTVNGLTYSSATAYGSTTGTVTGIARAGTGADAGVYVSQVGDTIYKVGAGLSMTAITLDAAVTAAYGLWGNPANGHLVAGTFSGIVDINLTNGHVTQIGDPSFVDGISVSPDGTIAYGEYNGTILGYSLTSPNPASPVFNAGAIGHDPDGTGVISGGALNGDIIVNNNDGTIGLIDPSLGQSDPDYYRIIMSGATRGDIVGPDLNNGTLLLSYTGYVERLGLTTGSIGSIGSDVPEPASLTLLGVALAGLGALRRRLRRQG